MFALFTVAVLALSPSDGMKLSLLCIADDGNVDTVCAKFKDMSKEKWIEEKERIIEGWPHDSD